MIRKEGYGESDLWKDCLDCKDKCCEWKTSFPFPLFITEKEVSIFKKEGIGLLEVYKMKEFHPCIFLNKEKKCGIHKIRPIDCRLFPFDVHKINGKFYWIIWKLPCAIVNKINREEYLNNFESCIIHNFKQYLESYSIFRCEELMNKYGFEVLREIKYD